MCHNEVHTSFSEWHNLRVLSIDSSVFFIVLNVFRFIASFYCWDLRISILHIRSIIQKKVQTISNIHYNFSSLWRNEIMCIRTNGERKNHKSNYKCENKMSSFILLWMQKNESRDVQCILWNLKDEVYRFEELECS